MLRLLRFEMELIINQINIPQVPTISLFWCSLLQGNNFDQGFDEGLVSIKVIIQVLTRF